MGTCMFDLTLCVAAGAGLGTGAGAGGAGGGGGGGARAAEAIGSAGLAIGAAFGVLAPIWLRIC
ncbi:hypothetical protein BpHYR1_029291 [Brachionus plicatilis]|uniref:Uncharacterized protein n=1 Tax=Brachionus plicatilis TaxID=10195 RepID=A0A3M7PD49_BRAPC|nr:hypothetical protein BpHYR1_029291 [Brachionus plicatilis]